MQFAVSVAGIVIMIAVAASDGVVRRRAGHARWRRRWGADGKQRSARMTSALLRYVDRGYGRWAFTHRSRRLRRGAGVPCARALLRIRPVIDEDGQGARQPPGGRHRRARRIVDPGSRGGRAQIGLARASGLGARREISVCAHQGDQPRRRTADGEAGGRAPGITMSFP